MEDIGRKTLAKIMNQAADLIEDGTKWGQGYFLNHHTGCFCAMGAILAIANGTAEDTDRIVSPFTPRSSQAMNLLGDDYYKIVEYNDKPGRRPATMAKYLRKLSEKYAG